jgi:hypothetical protein
LAEINLTQAEADLLIAMPKVKINNQVWDYPSFGGSISIPLTSTDKKENFILDVSRSQIDLLKGKYQNRGRQVVVLIRLDFGGAPHRNPDGTEISCPHLHLYRENYGDKWAAEIPKEKFVNCADPWQTLQDFIRYCNIIEPPSIEKGLFV